MLIIKDISTINSVFDKKAKIVGETTELTNVFLSYKDFSDTPKNAISRMDRGERMWLFKEINKAIEKIEKDKYTRKAIFYNLHKSKLEHNCLNVFHFYFREELLNLNVYVRSMNFKDNFEQDMYTFDIMLNKACKKLKMKKGLVYVHIMSLHKFNK